jgi:hypothetical protein
LAFFQLHVCMKPLTAALHLLLQSFFRPLRKSDRREPHGLSDTTFFLQDTAIDASSDIHEEDSSRLFCGIGISAILRERVENPGPHFSLQGSQSSHGPTLHFRPVGVRVVGAEVGLGVVGGRDGTSVGSRVGFRVGSSVGTGVVGTSVGHRVGGFVGLGVGGLVGGLVFGG